MTTEEQQLVQAGPQASDPNRSGGSVQANSGSPVRRAATAQRQLMRQELAAAAMELFASQGYEETTVDQIAAAAGVARRTFFRYFRSKEEAIFPDHDDTLVQVADLLASADPTEHPLDVVCRGIKEVLRMYAATPSVSVARYRLIRQVPTLREREIAVVARYERLFTRYLLGRFDTDQGDDAMLAEVSAAAVVAAHNHVLRRWLRAGGRGEVEPQLDHAFEAIRRTFWGDLSTKRTTPSMAPSATGSVSTPSTGSGEIVITVTRTDAPLDEVVASIRTALTQSTDQ
ncbi:TetR family transcriptional regulator [Streptacidiphilus fuscans]|uniref:TetR family transcriptional regulator n=1 Tax=Streptacidiphilus fuscans TaxID=2789292 RepID=A0A931B6H6_9ACTN|nr:TetR family transcriptional regulator [Streptacidiphilus fuscans]MBF9071319.1 TetR family transcriptional regulator [Streptacidiphilus fuscans]